MDISCANHYVPDILTLYMDVKKSHLHIAKRDITSYYIVKEYCEGIRDGLKPDYEITIEGLFKYVCNPIELNIPYKGVLSEILWEKHSKDDHFNIVEGSLASFTTERHARQYLYDNNMYNHIYKVVKCIIPKGTKYYKGWANSYHWNISESLYYMEILGYNTIQKDYHKNKVEIMAVI